MHPGAPLWFLSQSECFSWPVRKLNEIIIHFYVQLTLAFWRPVKHFRIFLTGSSAITCYKCESHRDYRCLDPFDYRPHISVNCDFEPYVRDRNPVFCEKVTELGKKEYDMLYFFSLRSIFSTLTVKTQINFVILYQI